MLNSRKVGSTERKFALFVIVSPSFLNEMIGRDNPGQSHSIVTPKAHTIPGPFWMAPTWAVVICKSRILSLGFDGQANGKRKEKQNKIQQQVQKLKKNRAIKK